jgi:hypothetical protein
VADDERCIGAKVYRASGEGEGGLKASDGGTVFCLAACRAADALRDRMDLAAGRVADGNADGRRTGIPTAGAVGEDRPDAWRHGYLDASWQR